MTKRNLALIIAALSSICSFTFCIGIGNSAVLGIGVLGAIAAYILGDGIGNAVHWACKIGWYIVPIFPADIVTGLVGLIIGFNNRSRSRQVRG